MSQRDFNLAGMAKIENDSEPLDDERVNLLWQVSGVQRSAFGGRGAEREEGGRREEMLGVWASVGVAFEG